MKREFGLFIKDILEHIEKTESFIADMSYEDFIRDTKTNFAVVRCVEIVGEAAKNIPGSIREKYKQVPWKYLTGMRDKIAHFYFGIDLKRVWEVATVKLPPLKPNIQQILADIASGETPHAAEK
ncbi:MAG: DUF86 domain-containing protein [Nitrospirota bacterium]|mgnify:FL=1